MRIEIKRARCCAGSIRTLSARAFGLLWKLFPASAKNALPIDAASRLAGRVRLLILAGIADAVVPLAMARRLYDTCNLPRSAREIWNVPRATHLRAFEAAPREYEEQLTTFLVRASEAACLCGMC